MKMWKCFMYGILFALHITCFIMRMFYVGFDIWSFFLIIGAIIWMANTAVLGAD